jgi:hypothetical protein
MQQRTAKQGFNRNFSVIVREIMPPDGRGGPAVFGWKQGSDMPQFYVHLAGEDRDAAFMKMNGLESISNARSENTAYVPQVCPRCKRTNSPDAKYCNGCGLALEVRFALELDQRKEGIKEKIERLSTELAKSPEVVDALLNALTTLRSREALTLNSIWTA